MKKFIIRFFCFFGFLFFTMILAGSTLFYKFLKSTPVSIESASILKLNIDNTLSDAPASAHYPFTQQKNSLRDIIDILHQASKDDRIEGLIVYSESSQFSAIAQIQEFRQAIKKFRKSGKQAIFYTDSFGELSTGIGAYYFATAFNEIWMQPYGVLNISGLSVQMPFFRDFLQDLGIDPEIQTREQYKNAYDSVKESRMTSAQREATHSILHSIFNQIIQESSKDRELTETVLMQSVNDSPIFNLKNAMHADLIDKIIHKIEIEDQINLKFKKKMNYLDFNIYGKKIKKPARDLNQGSSPKIAVIFANGMIAKQMPSGNPLMSVEVMEIDKIIDSILSIEKDPLVKAVVFRIDSPGGSPADSEMLWYSLNRMKQKIKKPLIISMANVAASGGYWIATTGDKIVASPATLTGSIGVLMGKIASEKLWQKQGIYWDRVEVTPNSSYDDFIHPFTEGQKIKVNQMLDYVYELFIQKVATGRHLSVQHVREVAKGRVWTGEQALQSGLIDALGGLEEAIEIAKEDAKLSLLDKKSLEIVYLPKVESLYEKISHTLKGAKSLPKLSYVVTLVFKESILALKSWILNLTEAHIAVTSHISNP